MVMEQMPEMPQLLRPLQSHIPKVSTVGFAVSSFDVSFPGSSFLGSSHETVYPG